MNKFELQLAYKQHFNIILQILHVFRCIQIDGWMDVTHKFILKRFILSRFFALHLLVRFLKVVKDYQR